jgi:hypothetical protein
MAEANSKNLFTYLQKVNSSMAGEIVDERKKAEAKFNEAVKMMA